MNLPYPLLADAWYWLAWGVWLPWFAWALCRAPWRCFLEKPGRSHVWLGMIVVLMLVWSLKAGVKPGLDLHLTGIVLFTLAFEPPLAIVGLNLVLSGLTLNGVIAWQAFALNALMTAGVGVALAHGIHRLVDRFLPCHFFIFLFLKGFFGSAMTVICIGLGFTLLYGLSETYAFPYLMEEYLPYYLLLGFSEAWLSGMALTLMLVYASGWVATFDDAVYLNDGARRGGGKTD
ncbi:MAG: energy-coupling factor ABC transporter permease [Zoogloeaceae bacterium]|jgi:uncharacterized membrane protein|nr:energy-coupling factor ABC transporter permease [Zoogloeaceae bacterium]